MTALAEATTKALGLIGQLEINRKALAARVVDKVLTHQRSAFSASTVSLGLSSGQVDLAAPLPALPAKAARYGRHGVGP